MSLLLSRRDLEFLLYDWLKIDGLTARPRYAEHSRETFTAALALCETLATDHFAPHNRLGDENEPVFENGRARIIPEVKAATDLFSEAGLIAAGADFDLGGMQLPQTIVQAGLAWFQAANVGTAAYPFLTIAAANLLIAHGSPAQIDRYVRPMMTGRFFGTMCLTEPQAGSSLSDVRTRAEPQPDGSWRLFGSKCYISGGEHDLSENIVHLVLARTPDAPPGVKGISLFVVPKRLVEDDGSCGARNDVALAGLIHKMGYRGVTSTILNFGEGAHRPGEKAGAIGWLVGERHRGLACMFHMMNEARVGVGLGSTALGYTGYLHALDYARTRPQGRSPVNKDPTSPQVALIEHADIRRMLLAQKSYVEGSLALNLYCGRLLDDERTAEDPADRARATLLLDMLTPIAKSWPAQWCVEANSLAIQVMGGYGYTRDYPVEQFYRDNRLNPIHEGTHGIQAIDLLGRKAVMQGGAGLRLLADVMRQTCARATHIGGEPAIFASQVESGIARMEATTARLHGLGDPERTLANAWTYLEAVGHLVVGWIWLEQRLTVGNATGDFEDGKRQAARYFFRWEMPRIDVGFDLLDSLDDTPLAMRDAWF
ncbi:acyl-CoA dehydrogenase [Brevundimonas variabilis]|uniref:3-methylmercaptopropionyl-CoA dehydrogenase n=1 Tax=Brevundimonas variabilis TaxID=74312 RepID=A0A7W9CJZ0_9CAUL|nr:acyl-CoA dehydrogenase [Brevundimonas variabilis]MBB5746597.1 butyryl-CoA dehydrogenase [Brevundimonas variabilis]